MNERMNKGMRKWVSKWVSVRVSGWVIEWMNEWMNGQEAWGSRLRCWWLYAFLKQCLHIWRLSDLNIRFLEPRRKVCIGFHTTEQVRGGSRRQPHGLCHSLASFDSGCSLCSRGQCLQGPSFADSASPCQDTHLTSSANISGTKNGRRFYPPIQNKIQTPSRPSPITHSLLNVWELATYYVTKSLLIICQIFSYHFDQVNHLQF
jgi:hypothetical protein